MWHDIFVIQIPVLEKILRTVLVYLAIVILFRLAGKRDLATFNTFDFVVIFLLSNVVQNAIIGNDDSLTGGVIGAAVLVAINAAFNRWLAASSRASRLLEGKPTTLIEDGHFIKSALRRLALRPAAGPLRRASHRDRNLYAHLHNVSRVAGSPRRATATTFYST